MLPLIARSFCFVILLNTINSVPQSDLWSPNGKTGSDVRAIPIETAFRLLRGGLTNRLGGLFGGKMYRDSQDEAHRRATVRAAAISVRDEQASGYKLIGENKFALKRVTDIGDIDDNGFTDYIVANSGANDGAGSVRLYLMAENDVFLYSRELIPGNWGFEETALNPGDAFGYAVLKLPTHGAGLPCTVAIGAPGDDDKAGAVYILSISRRGAVIGSSKVSAKDRRIADETYKDEEGFGYALDAVHDLNEDGIAELAIIPKKGMLTVLYLDSQGALLTDQTQNIAMGMFSPTPQGLEPLKTNSEVKLLLNYMQPNST